MGDHIRSNANDENAGPGLAALVLLSRLIQALIANRSLSSDELREALDSALLSLEEGRANSPIPAATDCARHCLEHMLERAEADVGAERNRTHARPKR